MSRDGQANVNLDGNLLHANVSFLRDDFMFVHRSQLDFERQTLRMLPHHVKSHTTIRTSQVQVDLFAARLVLPQLPQTTFNFIDFDMRLVNESFCPDGVWGRTACVPTPSAFTISEYQVMLSCI